MDKREKLRDEVEDGFEEGLRPESGAERVDGGNDVDTDNEKDTFNRTRKGGKVKCASVVFFPGGDVKVAEGSDLGGNCPPGLVKAQGVGSEDHLEL